MSRSESAVDGLPSDFNRNNQRENFMDTTTETEDEIIDHRYVKKAALISK